MRLRVSSTKGAAMGLAESQHCHFAFVAELFMCGPPGGLLGFRFSSRPHPRKCGVKRFLVVRGVAGAVVGWPILSYLLGKNYPRRDRDHLVPPRGWMQQSAVPRCAMLSVRSTGGIGQ